MKNTKLLILLIFIFPSTIKADVIYSPHTNFGTALSLEIIGSYELSFTKHNTVNFWVGFGVVSMIETFKNPAYGSELAIELRHYFKNETFENFNLGLYAGFAKMRLPSFYGDQLTRQENSVGFVPGLKLTYKKGINSWLVGEPYIGVSTPWYADNLEDLTHWISHSNPGLIFTIGLRIGFNKVHVRK